MKFNLDIKNKKAEFQADVENIVEKGMEQHEKDWKDKFNTKHNAKKEILEIKHKQKLEIEETNREKRNWFDRIQENKRKQKELEIEEQRRIEKEKNKKIRNKSIISTIIGTIALILIIVGFSSEDNASMALGGIALLWILIFMWADNNDKKKKK